MILEHTIFTIQLTMTGAACLFADKVGYALGLLDDPQKKSHGLHHKVTPLVGGIAILCPWLLVVLVFYTTSQIDEYNQIFEILSPLLIGSIGLSLFLGALDDRFHLSAKLRLWVKVVMFFALVSAQDNLLIGVLNFPSVGLYIPLGFASIFFSVLCLTALSNAVNMADGRNGIVIGMALIWLITLIFHVPKLQHPIMFALLAATGIVGWFNLRGLLFLGDAGSYAISSLVGLMAMWAHNQPAELGGLSTSQLGTLFIIPALDMIRLIIVRTLRGKSCMSPDHDHLHHRLDRCYGWGRGLPIYLLTVAAPIGVSLTGPKSGLMGMAIGMLLYLSIWFLTKRFEKETVQPA